MQKPLCEMNTVPSSAEAADAGSSARHYRADPCHHHRPVEGDDDEHSDYRLDDGDYNYYNSPARVVPITGRLRDHDAERRAAAAAGLEAGAGWNKSRRHVRAPPDDDGGEGSSALEKGGYAYAAAADKEMAALLSAPTAAPVAPPQGYVYPRSGSIDTALTFGTNVTGASGGSNKGRGGATANSCGGSMGALSAFTNFTPAGDSGDDSTHVLAPGASASPEAPNAPDGGNPPPRRHGPTTKHQKYPRSNSIGSVGSIFSAFSGDMGLNSSSGVIADTRERQQRRKSNGSGSGLRRTNSASNLRDYTDTIMSLKLQLAELHSELDASRQARHDAELNNEKWARCIEALTAERDCALGMIRKAEQRAERAEGQLAELRLATEKRKKEERREKERMERRMRELEEERDRYKRSCEEDSTDGGGRRGNPPRRGLFFFDGGSNKSNGASRRSSSGRNRRGSNDSRSGSGRSLRADGGGRPSRRTTPETSASSDKNEDEAHGESTELLEGFRQGGSRDLIGDKGKGSCPDAARMRRASEADATNLKMDQRRTQKQNRMSEIVVDRNERVETDSYIGWIGWNDSDDQDEGADESPSREGPKGHGPGGENTCSDARRNSGTARNSDGPCMPNNASAAAETAELAATVVATLKGDEISGDRAECEKGETDSQVGWYNGWNDDEFDDDDESGAEKESNTKVNDETPKSSSTELEGAIRSSGTAAAPPAGPCGTEGGAEGEEEGASPRRGGGGTNNVLRGIVRSTQRMGRRASINLVQPILASAAAGAEASERFLSRNGSRVEESGPSAVEDLLWDRSVVDYDMNASDDDEHEDDYRDDYRMRSSMGGSGYGYGNDEPQYYSQPYTSGEATGITPSAHAHEVGSRGMTPSLQPQPSTRRLNSCNSDVPSEGGMTGAVLGVKRRESVHRESIKFL